MARLTPRDIQEKEFGSGFRGYKEEEVDEFLDRITSSYEEVFKENIDLKEEVERLVEENKKYELIGERMQAALVAAQETADDVRKNATKEAENILREAEIKAHKMVQESRDQHRELQKSLAIVKQVEEEYRFKLKSTLQSYLKLLDEVAIGENKDVKQWILPEDMAALGERRREMEERESPAKAIKASPVAPPAVKKEETPAAAEALAGKSASAEASVSAEAPADKQTAGKSAPPEAPVSAEAATGKPAGKPGDTAPVPKLKAEEAVKAEEAKPTEAKAETPLVKKEEAPAAAEALAGKSAAAETPVSAEAAADKPAGKQKAEEAEKKPEAPKEAIIEDSKAKAAKLLDEIAAQAAEEKKAEAVKEAQKEIAEKAEEKKAETTQPPAKVEEKKPAAPEPPAAAEAAAGKPAESKVEAKAEEAKVPFDQEAGQASAVSAEWDKLQEAVDEAVKATEKPTKAEKEDKASESTMPGEMVESKPTKAAEPEAVKEEESEAKPKVEKEAKTGKSALEDIEIVEDESFWKDI